VDKPLRRVVVDFPDPLPLSESELALIESFYQSTIAQLADAATSEAAPLQNRSA
jgi:hypothetical protein